ncbi:MAG: TIGR03435 family protein [Candidatus Acidiferrales bacterium]
MTPSTNQLLSAAQEWLLIAAARAALVLLILPAAALAPCARAQAQAIVPGAAATASTAGFASVTIQSSQPGSVGQDFHLLADRLILRNYSLKDLIAFGFDEESALIMGPPTLDTRYNVDAKAPGPFPAAGNYDDREAVRAMVRKMLADQFQLQVNRVTQSESAYVLTAGPGSAYIGVAPSSERGPLLMVGPTLFTASAVRMHDIVKQLSDRWGRPVIDRTGLKQRYDFMVNWDSQTGSSAPDVQQPTQPSDPSPEALAAQFKTKLGLTLKLEQTPVEVLAVVRAESPTDLLPARATVPMDAKQFEQFVGSYALPLNLVVAISRDDIHFWAHFSGNPRQEIFPAGPRDFFFEDGDMQISFDVDAQGRATGLHLQDRGRNIFSPRVDDATASQMIEAHFAKLREKTATPGGEQAVRRLMAELASGKPDYDQMSPWLAQATQQQLPVLQPAIAALGAVVSVKFMEVDPEGEDVYLVTCEHGALEWLIVLSPDGTINNAGTQPAP